MALNMGNFQAVKNHAKQIMDLDRSGALSQFKEKAEYGFNVTNLGADNPNIEYQMQGMQQYQPMQQYYQDTAPMGSMGSRLPKAIKESMESNPIDVSPLQAAMGGGSVLDTLDPSAFENSKRLMPSAPKTKSRLQEQVNQQQTFNQTANVDYSLIKTIVEDCVKKSMVALKKSILNENTNLNSDNGLIYMQMNNGFKFVTKNGDIYEAKLKRMGNINDKK